MNTSNTVANMRHEGNLLFLEGILDFDSVVTLLPALDATFGAMNKSMNGVETSAVITVDLSAVTYSNSAGVAFLLDIFHRCVRQKAAVILTNIPEDMQDIIKMSGLQDVLATSVA